jgi:hypothetical protein
MRATMTDYGHEVLEYIEVAKVELKGIAQPREIAELSELALDVKDAESKEQLEAIYAQAKNLREFCERRSKSTAAMPRTIPPPRRI